MIKHVPKAFISAHVIIWKHGYWKFLFIPILISAGLALVLLGSCYLFTNILSHWIDGSINKLASMPDWVMNIMDILIFLILLGPCYILFRSMVMICYGPFLDRIAKKAEFLINGNNVEHDTSFFDSIKRPALMSFFSVIGLVAVILASFLLGLIPIAGIILSGAFTIPANLFLSSISYLDPYLERHGYTPKQSLKLMWRKRLTIIVFGLISFFITAIPIFGWFIGPTYSVVAGVILSIILYSEDIGTDNQTVSAHHS